MRVIVDTSVWSLALRRQNAPNQDPKVALLRDLILDSRVALLGVVRQEILSGIRHQNQYERLQKELRKFPNLELFIEDYELASQFYNTCRSHGVQGANTDFLICAAAVLRNYEILTTDKDFDNFSPYVPIRLINH